MADVIIEAAARALRDWDTLHWDESPDWYDKTARHVLAVVTPLIEARTLEHAASMAEEYFSDNTISGVSPQWVADEIAAMIRSFKEQP